MRRSSLLVFLCAWPISMPAQQVPSPPSGVIIGSVVDAISGRPIGGAVVGVGLPPSREAQEGTAAPPAQRQILTSGNGRFVITAVPAGAVSISATAPGYLPGGHGQRRPGGTTRAVVMTEGQREGPFTIQLWKPAAVEGRVVDEKGEPLVRIAVRALQRTWSRGMATFTGTTSVTTDDRGVFRLAGLTPGDWVVVVPVTHQTIPVSVSDEYARARGQGGSAAQDLQRAMMASGAPAVSLSGERTGPFIVSNSGLEGIRSTADGTGTLVYPVTYHPAPGPEGLDVLTLASGEERTGVELQIVPVPAVSVSGVLIGPDGPAARIGVRLMPQSLARVAPEQVFESARTVTDAHGVFTFLGVPAGDYDIKATVIPRPNMTGATTIITSASGGVTMTSMSSPSTLPDTPVEPTLSAAGRVSVGNRDLAGLSLTLQAGPRVSGTVEFVGTAVPPTPEQLQRGGVTLRPIDSGPLQFMSPGRFDADGRFKTMGYPAGRYVVTATLPGPGWALQSAMFGGRDVSIEPLTLESTDITGIVLTYSDRRSEISGAVVPSTGNEADGIVIAYPSDLAAWVRNGMNLRQMAAVRANSAGRYTITGLPAGEYLVAAVPNDVEIQTGNLAFYEALIAQSIAVVISHGEQRALDVRLADRRDDWDEDAYGEADDPNQPRSGPFVRERQAGQVPTRDVTSPSVGTGSIGGVVTLDDEAQTPVRRAQVRLTGSAASGVSLVTVTDDEGRFVFRALPAARYNINVSRQGFVGGTYGQARVGQGSGAPAALAEGQQIADLRIRMARGAVITGRVTDEFGQPLDRAQVSLMQFRTVNGERTLAPAVGAFFGLSLTDDRGEYRVFGLPAGEYVVGVAGRNTGSDLRRVSDAELEWADRPAGQPVPPRGPTIGAAPSYYPGTTDPGAAVPVRVNPGEERTGIDFTAGYVRTATVSGRIEMPDGTAPRTMQVNLFNEARVATPFLIGTMFVRTNPDGTFTTASVTPGRYSLIARAASPAPAGAQAGPPAGGRGAPPALNLWAQREVLVTGDDVTGVHVTLAPGMVISGRLTFDGAQTAPPTDMRAYTVRVFSAATTGVSLGVPTAPVAVDGTFRIEGLTPGMYRMNIGMPVRTGSLPDWTVRHIHHDDRDISEQVFDVRPGVDVAGLNVVLTDRVTEVTGTVTDAQGHPVTDHSVLLLPVDEQFWRTGTRRRPAPQRPDTTGRFRLIDVPAGDYYLALVTGLEPDQLTDTTFLQSLIPSAIRFTLAEGERKVQDVRLR